MGDPGNPHQPGAAPGAEPDPEPAGWAAPNPPPVPAPVPTPPPVAAPPWGTPPPTWGAPPGGPTPPGTAGGWQPPSGPVPKRRRLTWLWILIPVLLVLVASTVVVGVFATRLAIEPVDASNEYLAKLKAGRFDAAYASLCAPARLGETDVAALERRRADDLGRITSYDITGIEFPNSNDANDVIDIITTGTVVRGGFTYDIRVYLSRENDEWRVCSTSERG